VAHGVLRRVRRNRYVAADAWEALWDEGRHLVEVVSTHLNSSEPGPVFWGPSAAVLHGLPLYRHSPTSVHAAILTARHGRTAAGVMWHGVPLDPADIVERDGIRCKSLARTVLDLACTSSSALALSAADAALRSVAVSGQVQDEDAVGEWKDRMLALAERPRRPGIRNARRIIGLADGRAQLPGESVSRLHLLSLGFAPPELQVHVVGSAGQHYWLDFGFRRSRCFGEFDGQAKYVDDRMRGPRTAEEVVLAEKRREDDIRGVTGWRIVRWSSADIRSASVLGARLASFGIRPPG
jgi:hypothetical protein